ncbi:MAG: NADH-quinone oxidoreductase subunit NuoE [Bacteroidota bacterium]|jgi:NADH-quinone oxidoreductase subunit E|nr:NADH-quinone oxidoreductase subunit NuoE [Bacteroidota bacterium]
MAEQHNDEFKQFNVDLWKFDGHEGALIPLLQSAQDTYGYVPEKAMHYISHVTGIPAAEIYGVVTFYAQFRTRPLGKNIIRVCNGTACHVNGVKMLYDTLQEELGINYEETTEDGVFSLVSVACLGCCSLAPVLTINGEVFGRLTAAKTRKIIREFKTRTKATE